MKRTSAMHDKSINKPKPSTHKKFLQTMPVKNLFSKKVHNKFIVDYYRLPREIVTTEQHTLNHSILIPVKGSVVINAKINGRRHYNIKKIGGESNLFLIPTMNEVSWNSKPFGDSKDNFESIGLYFYVKKFNKILTETYDKDSRNVELLPQIGLHDGLIKEITCNIYTECKKGNPSGQIYVDTMLNMLAIHLLSHYCSSNYRLKNCRGGLDHLVLRTIKEYIEEKHKEDISLEELASLACMSKYHFARLFEQSTSLPPHQYLMQRRIEKSKELLKHTKLTVENIALEVGYESVSHFRNIFRRAVGVTPKKYRDL